MTDLDLTQDGLRAKAEYAERGMQVLANTRLPISMESWSNICSPVLELVAFARALADRQAASAEAVKRNDPGRGSIAHTVGHRYRNKTRIVVAFEDDTFAVIRQMALKEKTSFAEQVRTLVEWGLEEARRP